MKAVIRTSTGQLLAAGLILSVALIVLISVQLYQNAVDNEKDIQERIFITETITNNSVITCEPAEGYCCDWICIRYVDDVPQYDLNEGWCEEKCIQEDLDMAEKPTCGFVDDLCEIIE